MVFSFTVPRCPQGECLGEIEDFKVKFIPMRHCRKFMGHCRKRSELMEELVSRLW